MGYARLHRWPLLRDMARATVALVVVGFTMNAITDGSGDMEQRPKCESSDIRNGAARP